MNELDLIEKAKKGNKSALNELICYNLPIVKGYIIKMTANPDISQDILQETLLKGVLNISKFKPKAKFSTYLITIATNVYRDFLRKNKNIMSIENLEHEIVCDSYEESSLSKFEYSEIIKILLSISYEKRAAFILKHYYGYKYEDIAKILKCPVGTIRSRIHNCIAEIISEMKVRGFLDE